jgi:hypothetical protein
MGRPLDYGAGCCSAHMEKTGGQMKALYLGLAGLSLLAVSGCAGYPAVQTTMAQALPPYHPTDTADLNTAQGIKPVESATHNYTLRLAPFF